ncbi:MAG: SBBP repeat-containing protein [Bacteroidota bacterium]
MRTRLQPVLLAMAFCLSFLFPNTGSSNPVGNTKQPTVQFHENKGQITDQSGLQRNDVLFMGTHGDAQYIITNQGVSHQVHTLTGEGSNQTASIQRIDMQWVGSTFRGKTQGYKPQEGITNHYGSRVIEGVKSYEEVRLFEVYPGIHVRFYSIDNLLEYDFELAPNTDWHQIQIRVSGTQARINSEGELEMPTAMGVIRESAPRVFQEGKKLDSRWVIVAPNTFGFEITNAVKGKAITIDPVVLIWSSQIGGTGNETADAISTDGSGNVFIAGNTNSIRNIATTGSHQSVIGGIQDAYIAKFDQSGRRVWATYYGSVGNESGQACTVDGLGNIYLSGQAGGAAPNSIATAGSYQAINASGSFDLYLAKFNASGLRQWATYYGGSGVENYADLATDGSGNIYLAGITNSSSGIATAGAHQTTIGGSTDGFVVKFTGGGTRIWATYHGGSLDEGSQISCATDINGNLALAGETRSTNNMSTSGSYQQSIGGNYDAWIARFTSSGVRNWSTYLGGSAADRGRSVAFDGNGNVVVTGWTSSTSGIATAGAHQTTFGGGTSDAMVASFQPNGAINWSTYKGGTTSEQGFALAIENSGKIFLLTNGPTAIESFASNGTYLTMDSYTGPFYGALLNICSGGNGIVFASGQANNNALVEKYQIGSVSGLVFNDANQNCIQESGEAVVPNMRFTVQPGNLFVQSDNNGRISILSLPDGNYTIYPDTIQSPWFSTCGNSIAFIVTNGIGIITPIGIKPKDACSAPDITIYSQVLRPCLNSQKVRVSACNKSTATVNLVQAYADVEFDPNIIPVSSSLPYIQTGSNTFRFLLGDITPGNCVDFNVFVDVDCNVISGQSLCMEAKLFPADSCAIVNAIYPGTQNGLNLYGGGIPCTMPWDTSAISVKGLCQNGTVFFDVFNSAGSNGNMMCYSQVRIYTDGILTQVDSVMLMGGGVKSYALPGTGQTMRLEVDQHPLAPFYSTPSVTVELCGGSSNWTPGLVNSLPSNDASPATDIFCAVADEVSPTFSKKGFPLGVTSANLIYPNRQLQYFIEFANTSNDTAFTAVVRDTLDQSLNALTVTAGGSSHPYQFRIYGNNILEWRFNNLNLPPAANGDNKAYVSFTVEQNPDLPDNTVINNKAFVAFNAGAFIGTNSTFHTVGRQLFSVQACPPPSISGVSTICQGATTTLTASPGYASYQWSNGANTPSIIVSTSGTYTVTVVDFTGCSNSASRTVTVNSNPSPSITGTFTVCFGNAATLNASTGFASYLWSDGSTTSSISTTTSGVYTVTVTNGFGCTGTASQTATINPKPTPSITGVFDVCQGNSALLNATPGFTSYLWSNGATSSSIGPTTSGTYTVTVTNSSGCTGVAQQTVTVIPTPQPSITGNSTICQGETATLTAAAGFNSYLWSNGASTQTISVTTGGTYTVTVTNSSGCTGSKSQVVLVNPSPSPSISGVFSACQGAAATLSANAGFSSYSWSNGANTQTINPTVSGNYTVTVTNANGCSGSVSQSVSIIPSPTPNIAGNFSVCQGAAATLTASSGFVSYSWSTGANTQTINPTVAGIYTVTVTNANGCTGTASQQVNIGAASTSSVSVQQCPGTSYTLPNGQVVSTSGTYITTISASNGCDSVITTNLSFVDNLAPIVVACPSSFTSCNPASWAPPVFSDNCSFTVSSNFQPGATLPIGNTTITYTATDAGGNATSCSFVVTVVDFTVAINQTNVSCNGGSNGSASAVATGTSGTVSYLWSNGATSQTINNLIAGTYTVTVTNGNCSRQASVNITQPGVFTTAITPNGPTVFCQGGSVTLTASSGASYLWSTGATTQSIVVGNSGSYSVTVTNASGCTAIAPPIAVTVNPNVNASVSISSNPSGAVTANTSITFTAVPVNGGSTPVYQWKKNGVNVGTNSSTYVNNAWVNNDVVHCAMTSNANCVIGSPATSNNITVNVNLVAGAPKYVVSDSVTNSVYYYDSLFVFISSSTLSTNILNGNTSVGDINIAGGFGYVMNGLTPGRAYRSSQAGTAALQSRNLRSNTGGVLNPATGIIVRGDTLNVLDKKARAIFYYLTSQAFNGATTNYNAIARKNLASQNANGEALGFDNTYLYVLENGNTKAIYRYLINSTTGIIRSRPLQTVAGAPLNNILGMVVDGTRVLVTDNGVDSVYVYLKSALYTGSNTIPLNAIAQYPLSTLNLTSTGIALASTTSLLREQASIEQPTDLFAWPNPTSGVLNINLKGFDEIADVRLTVFDLNGRLVIQQTIADHSSISTIDLTGNKPGLYAIVVEQGCTRKTVRVVVD